nr:MAG TPA: protein of unknown function (DUF5522) [Caudoviricetes sp.]
MDAVKFLKERARMCGHGCKNCPAYGDECDIYKPNCDYESLVEAVEAWAAKHPRKTQQSEFLKQWPDAMVYSDGVLDIYPCILEKARRCDKCNNGCTECRHEFWNQAVE